MREIVMTARTVEEAIELALKELDVDRVEVEVNVISRGKSGILGIGGESAKVRVEVIDSPSDTIKAATEVIDEVVSLLGISVVSTLTQAEQEEIGGPAFDLEGDDAGLLIGRRGETLKSFQFLIRHIVSQRLGARANVNVDVEGYQERRYQSVANLARRVAQRVADTGRSISMEPMPANERRIVHMALSAHPNVTTESFGEGAGRQVVVNIR